MSVIRQKLSKFYLYGFEHYLTIKQGKKQKNRG